MAMVDFPKRIDAPRYMHESISMVKPATGFCKVEARELQGCVNYNREFLRPWLQEKVDPAYFDAMKVVESVANQSTCQYILRVDGWVAGMIGVMREDKNTNTMEIAYWLDKRYSGRRIMSWAVGKIEKLCFLYGGAKKLEARCGVYNEPAIRILERLGWTQQDGKIRTSGVPYEVVVYSKMLSDWLNKPTGLANPYSRYGEELMGQEKCMIEQMKMELLKGKAK